MKHPFYPDIDTISVINLNKRFPDFVFVKKFQNYLFFDADICSSSELVDLLKEILEKNIVNKSSFSVSSYDGKKILGTISFYEDWNSRIKEIVDDLRSDKDHNGIILCDRNASWALVQSTPVEVGVLAFGEIGKVMKRSSNVADGFFVCHDILDWLKLKDYKSQSMANNFGIEFLKSILINYCT